MDDPVATDFEPSSWLVVFHQRARNEWVNRLVRGRFKHVSAFGWVANAESWVYYDPTINRTQILVLPDKVGVSTYARLAVGNAVLQVQVGEHRSNGRLGFWCVPAIKHLLGMRSGALRPDTLWRDCLANGAKVICDDGRRANNRAIRAHGGRTGTAGRGEHVEAELVAGHGKATD